MMFQPTGSGSSAQGGLIGDRELITNTDIETDASGYTAYADAAGSSPVDGTGGAPSSTVARSTSSPITGTGSLLWTKSGSANRQGEGFSIPFTVGTADQAKVLQIDFDYIIGSGTFVAGTATADSDMTVWIYDVTNSVLIQPSTFRLYSNSSTISDHFRANFQTSSNGTSYRLIVHTATTSTSNYTLKFDNISIHPSKYTFGTPINDLKDYGPISFTSTGGGTLSKGTVVVDRMLAERFGSLGHIRYEYMQSTAGSGLSAGTLLLGLPPGWVIDTTLQYTDATGNGPSTGANDRIAAPAMTGNNGWIVDTTNTGRGTLQPKIYDSTHITAIQTSNLTSFGIWAATSSYSPAAAIGFAIDIWVPLAGASSSVQMSSVADNRLVAASYYVSANFAASTTVPVNFDTKDFDTHAAVTPSATVWTFTAPVAGTYRVSSAMKGSTSASILIYKNGSAYKTIGGVTSTAPGGLSASIQLNAGDTIALRPDQGVTITGGTQGTAATGTISIELLGNPAAIAATETVAASYWCSANFAATTSVPVNFDSKEFDTHSAVTPSATVWKFTAPAAGVYGVLVAQVVNTGVNSMLYKNGSVYKYIGPANGASTGGGGTVLVRLLAGDTIDVRPTSNATYTGGTLATSGVSNINIWRVGL